VGWMGERGVGLTVVLSPSNVRYLSGTEHAYALVVGGDGEAFLVAQYAFGDGLAEEETFLPVRSVKPEYERGRKWAGMARSLAGEVRSIGLRFKRVACDDPGSEEAARIRAALKREFGRRIAMVDASMVLRDMRAVKSGAEIRLIREAARVASRAFEEVCDSVREGVTEIELAAELEARMRVLGAERPSFDSIVAFGEHTFNAHHAPTRRRLRRGEPVLFDFGASLEGYKSDVTRTYFFGGEPDDRFREVYEAVLEAQEEGMREARPGAEAQDPDLAAREVLKGRGLAGYFVHSLGHGVGLEIHEHPRLLVGRRDVLREGMAVTIEPGVYIKGWGGVRIEDTVALGRGGTEVLTEGPPKEVKWPW